VEHFWIELKHMAEKPSTSDQVHHLPHKPGVYQFLDSNGEILYIGKAKNLRKRVSAYFPASDTKNYKQEVLIRKTKDIKYIIVENESDALLLENNLIKEYQPKYNILLKDDKTYPWICIKKERFQRVFQTRTYINDGSDYFGPYTSGVMVKTLLDLIKQLFKLRTCKLSLSELGIRNGKFKKCLEFQLGNCKGPCEGLQSLEDYDKSIVQIKEILKGNYQQVVKYLRKVMIQYAQQLKFEEAERIKRKIEILEKFKGKSTIVNPKISNVDVFSFIDETNYAYVNFLKVVKGAIVQAHNIEVKNMIVEDRRNILTSVVFELRTRFKSTAREIIVPFKPDFHFENIHFTVPVKGDKQKLLELSLRNAVSFKNDKTASRSTDKWLNNEQVLLIQLQSDLKLKKVPSYIECFDNSNLQGSNPVASCVVFRDARPEKSSYRHYNIKTVKGPDDYSSMEEVISRRYRHILTEDRELPDLIIIDGGKGQLNSAIKTLKKLNLYDKIAIISIAKRLEEIFAPDDTVPLYLDKKSSSLRLLQRIRNEAHRFGIAFHRNKRSGSQIKSSFINIPGIGVATVEKILRTESDIVTIKKMSLKELISKFGKRSGQILFDYFKKLE